MKVTLQNISEERVIDAIVIKTPAFVIGRDFDCDLRLICPRVSRIHCEVTIHDGYVAVRDLHSANGTRVNGEFVESEKQLFSGDRLSLGSCSFEVYIDPARVLPVRIEEPIHSFLNDRAPVAVGDRRKLSAC